jgi:zinc and cadmium transporter
MYDACVKLVAVTLALSAIGSFGGLLIASLLLATNDRVRLRLIPWVVSYAVGALLGVALLELLPDALRDLAPASVFGTLLVGILVFFVLEKLVLWRHCHTNDCLVHSAAVPIILIGGGVHHFVDGAVIGASALTSLPLAASMALAIAAHEIPQGVGDFAILLAAGYTRGRALSLNFASAASGLMGALLAIALLRALPGKLPFFLAFAAASFLYIAMADLIPDLHRGQIDSSAIRQVLLVAAGIVTILAF